MINQATYREVIDVFPLFSSQPEAKTFVREHLESCLRMVKAEDDKLLDILVRCHPDFARKFGGSNIIKEFIVDSEFGNPTLLVETDKGSMDISWVKCAQNLVRIEKGVATFKTSNNRNHVYMAMRKVINDQIVEFRKSQLHNGYFINAITGCRLYSRNAAVDHYKVPFIKLADDWLTTIGGIKNVKIEDDKQSFRGFNMTDENQIRLWQEYHRQHAKLRMIAKSENNHFGSYGYNSVN